MNNKFLKFTTLAVLTAFVLEAVPFQALASLCKGPTHVKSWDQCQWSIEPKGKELSAPSFKEIRLMMPDGKENDWCSTDSAYSQFYVFDPNGTSSWDTSNRSDFPPTGDLPGWDSGSITTSLKQVLSATTESTYYKLKLYKVGWQSVPTSSAVSALYGNNYPNGVNSRGVSSSCPINNCMIGNYFCVDECISGTTNSSVVNYCVQNPSACITSTTIQKVYSYVLTEDHPAVTYRSAKIIEKSGSQEECNGLYQDYQNAIKQANDKPKDKAPDGKTWTEEKDYLYNQLINSGCYYLSEVKARKSAHTQTVTKGDLITCGRYYQSQSNLSSLLYIPCPTDTSNLIAFPEGARTPFTDENGVQSTLGGWRFDSTLGSRYDYWDYYYFKPLETPTVTNLSSETISTSTIKLVDPTETVAGFIWNIAGYDDENKPFGDSVNYSGIRAVYLSGDGTVWDANHYKKKEKSGGFLNVILGFLIGMAINTITGGGAILSMTSLVQTGTVVTTVVDAIGMQIIITPIVTTVTTTLLTWGDLVVLGSLFSKPGSSISVGVLKMVPCNITSLPPSSGIVTPFIRVKSNDEGKVILGIIPDSTKVGTTTDFVLGYSLSRQGPGESTPTLIYPPEGGVPAYTNPEEAYQEKEYIDSNLQLHKTYLYTVWPILSSTSTLSRVPAVLEVYTKALPKCTFSAKPSTVYKNQKTKLSWECKNVDKGCSIDNKIGSVNKVSGSKEIGPLQKTTTYTLTCKNTDGEVVNKVTVKVISGSYHEVAP